MDEEFPMNTHRASIYLSCSLTVRWVRKNDDAQTRRRLAQRGPRSDCPSRGPLLFKALSNFLHVTNAGADTVVSTGRTEVISSAGTTTRQVHLPVVVYRYDYYDETTDHYRY